MKHEWIEALTQIFKQSGDRYEAHRKIVPVLEAMSRSTEFLYEVIRQNLADPAFLKRTRHYSTLTMTIHEEPDFSFIVNIFPPLPDRRTDISFQSIHHHGSLLLTSVAAFGPGYRSMLFRKGFSIDYATGETQMALEKEYQNTLHEPAFVDSYQPHIVFYPSDFSATYALWCNETKNTKELLRNIGFIKNFKKPLVKLAKAMGIGKRLGINEVAYFDFYPEGKKIIAMKTREAYDEAGSNENFLQNIFAFVQQTGFNDEAFLQSLISDAATPAAAKMFAQKLLDGEKIADHFFEGHLNIPRVNLERDSIIYALS